MRFSQLCKIAKSISAKYLFSHDKKNKSTSHDLSGYNHIFILKMERKTKKIKSNNSLIPPSTKFADPQIPSPTVGWFLRPAEPEWLPELCHLGQPCSLSDGESLNGPTGATSP